MSILKNIAVDCETHLIKPGCLAPKLVCVTAHGGTFDHTIWDATEGMEMVERWLRAPGVRIGGHHFPYDLGVFAAEKPALVPLIFDAINAGEIYCTKIRDKMIENAKGFLKYELVEDANGMRTWRANGFHLANLALRHLDIQMAKGADTWRLRYNELDGVPLDEWPNEARDYAIKDAVVTHEIFQKQEKLAPNGIPGEIHQMGVAWAFQLMSMWGVVTDPPAVEAYKAELLVEYETHLKECQRMGWVRENGTVNKAMAQLAVVEGFRKQGLKAPVTNPTKTFPEGQVKTDADTYRNADMVALAEKGRVGKTLTTYIPILEHGAKHPINAGYNPILETFRTSCSRPNLQNPPRKGKVRYCFVPRKGRVYIFCDYGTLEMRSLAQILLDLFGQSKMAEILIAGKDPHLMMAANMLDLSYDEALARYKAGDPRIKENREAAKPADFGFPGAMGWSTFVEYAWKSYGVRVTPEKAKQLHGVFRETYPEMLEYFAYCKKLAGKHGAERIKFPRSKQIRGKVRYTAICNGFFQELAARGAKEALYEVSQECYTDKSSVMYGSRPVFFLHDEIGMETPYGDPEAASNAAFRLSECMIDVMQRWVPDIPILADAVMMCRWYKGAKPVYENEMLIPCKPIEKDGNEVWIADVWRPLC